MNLRKFYAFLLSAVFIVCFLTACSSNKQSSTPQTDINTQAANIFMTETTAPNTTAQYATPATQIKEITSTGQISFDLVGSKFSDILLNMDCDPLIPFMYNNTYGFVDETGDVIINNIYDKVAPFSEGKAVVKQGEEIKIIDTSGAELISLPMDKLGFNENTSISDHMYNDGILYFNNNYIFDSNLNLLSSNSLKGRAYYIYSSRNNCVFLRDYEDNNLLAMPGESIYNCPYSKMKFPSDNADVSAMINKIFFANDGYANVCNENMKWGLYDINTGTISIDYQYDYVGMYSDGVIPVSNYDKWGVIDLQGNILIPCKNFKYIGPFCNGYAYAVDGENESCIIDKSGNVLSRIDLYATKDDHYVLPFSEKSNITFILTSSKTYHCINSKGELLLSFDKYDYKYITDNYLAVNDKLYKFVNE